MNGKKARLPVMTGHLSAAEEDVLAMIFSIHGGHCCGIHHMWGFPMCRYEDEQKERIKRFRELIIEYDEEGLYDDDEGPCEPVALEVTITQRQKDVWGSVLLSVGFKEVYSFRNPNTRNIVYVFFRDPVK